MRYRLIWALTYGLVIAGMVWLARMPDPPATAGSFVKPVKEDKSGEMLRSIAYCVDGNGLTTLHLAACVGDTEVVSALIAAGADPKAKGGELKETPLHLAARGGRLRTAQLLVGKGADVNARDARGWTPLHEAVAEGRIATSEALIAMGADLHARTLKGRHLARTTIAPKSTPLEVAAQCHNSKMIEFLRRHKVG